MRLLRAFVWLRWRLKVRAMSGAARRDRLERFSRALSALLPVLLLVVMVPGALALAAGAAAAGFGLARVPEMQGPFLVLATLVPGAILVFQVVAPLFAPRGGGDAEETRLALLPISPAARTALDLASSGLADPWLLALLPSLLALPVGLAAGGAPARALAAAAAGALLFAFLAAFGLLVGAVLRLVYRDRRRGEAVTLGALIVLTGLAFLPMALQEGLAERERSRAPAAIDLHGLRDPGWVAATPPGLYAHASVPGRAAASLAGLAAWTAGACLLAGAVSRRLRETPASGSGRRGGTVRWTGAGLAGLGPGAGAVARATMRRALRSVQGKVAVWFSPAASIAVVVLLGRGGSPELVARTGPPAALFAAWLCVVGLQKLHMNQFAVDGPGLTLQFLAPLSDREIVDGKGAAYAVLAGIPSLLCLAVIAALRPGAPWPLWAAVPLALAAGWLLTAPAAALLSAWFPKVADPGSIGRGSNASAVASLAGFLVASAALGVPAGLGALAALLSGPGAALLSVAAWLAVAAAGHLLLRRAAIAALAARRENLALTASGR